MICNDDKKDIIIAIDYTRIKVTNRVYWMQEEKWRRLRKKKGFIMIHVTVNIKAKRENTCFSDCKWEITWLKKSYAKIGWAYFEKQ